MTLSQCHQNILPKALCRCCIQQHSLWDNSAELHSHPAFFWGNFPELYSNTLIEAILRNCILKIFPSRQLSGVVLYKSLFKAIPRNCILKIFTVRQLSGVVSPHFVLKQLYRVVFPQNISSEAILRNCILKIFTVRQLSGVVSPHFVLEQLYGVVFPQNISFEAILWNCILKIFS